MTLHASDILEADVVSISPDASLLDVHRLFVEEEIHGAPVVDDDGRLLGVISTLDLLRAIRDEYDAGAGSTMPAYYRGDLPYSGPHWIHSPEDLQDRMATLKASDVMVRELVSVAPDTPVAEVARVLRDQRIHRVFVIDGGRMLGLISTFDLVRLLEREPEVPAGEARP